MSDTQKSFGVVYDGLAAEVRLVLHAAARLNPQRIIVEELNRSLIAGAGWDELEVARHVGTCLDLQLLQGETDLRMPQLLVSFVRTTPPAAEIAVPLKEVARAQSRRLLELAEAVAAAPHRTDLARLLAGYALDRPRGTAPEDQWSFAETMVIGQALSAIGQFATARSWFECAAAQAEQGDAHGRVDHASLDESLSSLAACLAFLPKSSGLSKQQFRDRVCEAIRQRIPDLNVEPVGELTIRASTPSGDMEGTSWLDRSYEELRQEPHKLDNIVDRVVQGIQSGVNYSVDLDLIIPCIKTPKWLQAQPEVARPFIWTDPYNSDLIIAYAQYRQGLMYGFTKDLGLPREELWERALANLRRMSPQIKVMGTSGFYAMTAGNMWNSSLMLLKELLQHPALGIKGGRVMAVPDRDSFYMVDDTFPPAIFQLGIAATTDFRREPYPLCPRLFAWREGRWEPLDSKLYDPSQTIVNPAEVAPAEPDGTGGCILPLTIPDPLTPEPRSVYRLFLKLNAYLEAAGSSECCRRFGSPTPESHCILARIHAGSDPSIRQILRLAEYWLQDGSIKDTRVRLRVEEDSSATFH